jgi:hypothetical protein
MNATATAERSPARESGRARTRSPAVALQRSEPATLVPAHYHGAGPSLSIGAALQPKVAVGQPGDAFEREADSVSEQVREGVVVQRISHLAAAEPQAAIQREADEASESEEAVRKVEEADVAQTFVQRQAEDDEPETEKPEEADVAQTFVQREAEDDEPETEEPEEADVAQTFVQRQAEDDEPETEELEEPDVAQTFVQACGNTSCDCSPEEHAAREGGGMPPAVVQGASATPARATSHPHVATAIESHGGGDRLGPTVRGQMEDRTGYDLSDVRVHQGGIAQSANKALGARAFTHGGDIWLGAGESPTDLRLMAHESTHVVQQSGLRSGLQLVQRSPADYRHPEDGGNVRGRLDRRFAEIDRSQAEENGNSSTATADGRRSTRTIDRGELRSQSAELGGATRPDVDRPGQEAPRIDSAAATVVSEAVTPPTPLVPGQPTSEPKVPGEKLPPDPAEQAAARAAGAFGAADAQPEPAGEAEVVLPEPVSEPVDRAGEALDPDPQADDQVASLAARAQSLREQGTRLRAQAAEAHANADIVRGNISKVSGEVSKAEAGIAKSKDHTTYRREVIGQTDQALGISKEKQAQVAAEAPGFQSKADEGKEDSGPMAGEARSLAAENAGNAPDDDEAAAKSREQGAKIDRVGNDAGTMDDAVSQTRSRADSLQQDSARASRLNDQTQTNVTSSQAKLDELSGRLTAHTTETSEARAQVTGLASAPAALHAQANNLDASGQQVIASSYELEASLQQTQSSYAEQMAGVPGIEPYEGEIPEDVEPSGGLVQEAAEAGVLIEGFGETPDEEAAAATSETEEDLVQTQPDERALTASGASTATAPSAAATPAAASPTSTAAAPPTAGVATPLATGSGSTPSGGAPAVLPGTASVALPTELPDGSEQEGEAPGPEEAAGEEEPAAGPGSTDVGPAPEGAGGETGEAAAGADEPLAELESQPEPTEGRQQVDVMARLPGWLTGVEPQSAAQRSEGEAAANESRRAELNRINELAGGRMVSELTAGERLAIAGRLVLGRYTDTVKGIKWPGWGGLAKMLLDPRSMLTGAVSGLQMILSGGANLFSLAQWQRDPLGNLLKSAADIATGLAIILASITALAGLVAAIMGALIIITFGAASPIALPVISVCTTIITTVGGWTIAVGKIALVLQALSLIKNLIDAATAQTAEELQREAGEIQSDINGGAQAVMSIAGAKGATAGIRNVRGRVAGVLRASRRAGGSRALARATASAGRQRLTGLRQRFAGAARRRPTGPARARTRPARAARPAARQPARQAGVGPAAPRRRRESAPRARPARRSRPGPVNRETRQMLRNQPTTRQALQRNPRAAQALRSCGSVCYPPNATPAQIRRLENILARAERNGVGVDMARLRTALHAARGNLDGALRDLSQELRRGLSRRRAITGEFRAAGARGVRKAESEVPVATSAGVHLLVGVERHHPVFKMFLRAFDKMGIKGIRTATGRLRRQNLIEIPTNTHRAILHELWDTLAPGMARGRGASTRMATRLERLAMIRSRVEGLSMTVARRRVATEVLHQLQGFYDVALRDSAKLVALQREIDRLRRLIDL